MIGPLDPPLHLRSTSKKRGGSNFGPNVKKPTSWPKRGGGSGPPGPPLDPLLIPTPHTLPLSLPLSLYPSLSPSLPLSLCLSLSLSSPLSSPPTHSQRHELVMIRQARLPFNSVLETTLFIWLYIWPASTAFHWPGFPPPVKHDMSSSSSPPRYEPWFLLRRDAPLTTTKQTLWPNDAKLLSISPALTTYSIGLCRLSFSHIKTHAVISIEIVKVLEVVRSNLPSNLDLLSHGSSRRHPSPTPTPTPTPWAWTWMWVFSCLSSPGANLHPTQSITLYDQTYNIIRPNV